MSGGRKSRSREVGRLSPGEWGGGPGGARSDPPGINASLAAARGGAEGRRALQGEGARTGEVGGGVDRRVERRRDAEDARQRLVVREPVHDAACGGSEGVDRLHGTTTGAEGAVGALLADFEGPAAQRADRSVLPALLEGLLEALAGAAAAV